MRRIIAFATISGLLILGLEVTARYGLGLGTPPLSMPHPEIEYMFRPNQDVSRFGNRQLYNEYGMRSPKLPDPTEQEIVLVMGDSVLNGGNLTDHADLATSIASQRASNRIYANISAGSWGPANIRGYLDTYGTFGAGAVIFVFNSGDIEDIPQYGPLNPATHPQARPLWAVGEGLVRYAPRHLPESLAGWLQPDPVPRSHAKPADIADGVVETRRMMARLAEEDIPVCIVLHGTRDSLPDDTESEMMLFRSLAADFEVPTMATRSAFLKTGREVVDFYRDHIHINEAGQAVLADLLLTCRNIARIPELN